MKDLGGELGSHGVEERGSPQQKNRRVGMNSRIRSKPNGFNNDRVKRAVKEMHIEDYNVNHFYDMAQDSLVQPDEDEMVRIFGTLVVVIVDVGDFNVRYRWIKFGNNIELISLTENDSLFKYGRESVFDSWKDLSTQARE